MTAEYRGRLAPVGRSAPDSRFPNGGRFRLESKWRISSPADSQSGQAAAVSLTGDTGYFWFFSSNNIELVVKVVDGRAVNGKFWVFYGAL